MKQEILDLIDIYEHEEIYQQQIAEAKKERIPNIPKILELHGKINFDKNRQRAELLKLNDIFLNELKGIKNRLGKKFFETRMEEIPEAAQESPRSFYEYGDQLISNSDFTEVRIIISELEFIEGPNSEPINRYYRPDPIEMFPGGPLIGLEPGAGIQDPRLEVELPKDPHFNGTLLEAVIVDINDVNLDEIRNPKFLLDCKKTIFKRYSDKWQEFVMKWHISSDWNGELEYLSFHSLPSLMIEIDHKNQNLPIIIRLGAWATLDDIKKSWPTVERQMDEARLYRERESDNFLRDLTWYRMNKDEEMSPAAIAQFWAARFSKEIDLETIEKITRDDPTFANVDPEERLKEALSGDTNLSELRDRFKEERALFLRYGLKDKVKKSIKNLAKKIDRIGSEYWDRNRKSPFHRAVSPKDRDRILQAKYPKDHPEDGEK